MDPQESRNSKLGEDWKTKTMPNNHGRKREQKAKHKRGSRTQEKMKCRGDISIKVGTYAPQAQRDTAFHFLISKCLWRFETAEGAGEDLLELSPPSKSAIATRGALPLPSPSPSPSPAPAPAPAPAPSSRSSTNAMELRLCECVGERERERECECV